MDLLAISHALTSELDRLDFGAPVTHVYNPLHYAWAPFRLYVERYGTAQRNVLLVGMNPGPWGMVQTGVPFGDVISVREWLGIEAPVGRPRPEHPRRPVLGFACTRREPSGRRLWAWARERFGTPDRFFGRFFVLNYCPLCFFEGDGRNRTPDRLPTVERKPLFEVCDKALGQAIRHFQPQLLIGIGRFAQMRLETIAEGHVRTVGVPHPSPANTRQPRDWGASIDGVLAAEGIV